jgi:PAS domain S-box-containing protein
VPDSSSASTRPLGRVALGFGVLLALVAVLLVLSLVSFHRLSTANRWSTHTYEVLGETEGLMEGLVQMEASFRGFGLSGQPRMLATYRDGQRQYVAHLRRLTALTADSPEQRARLRQVDSLARTWTALQAGTGFLAAATPDAVQRARGLAASPADIDRRVALMDRMREVVSGVAARERALLGERTARAARLQRLTYAALAGGGGLAIVLAVALATLVARRTRVLRDVNAALEAEVAERKLAQRLSERLFRQNELILQSVSEGIYGVDAAGYTTFLNPSAAAMLGMGAADLVGRPLETGLGTQPGPDGAPGPAPVRDTLRTGAPARAAAMLRRADGTWFPAELASAPVVEDGRIVGAVATFRDETERREVERMKDEFISIVSHELRTPLTSIRGSLGLLAGGKAGAIPERAQRLLDIAVQNTDRLIRLINDILDIERMESGKATLELRTLQVAQLLDGTTAVMESMAERAGVRLRVEAEPGLSVRGDPDRLTQVLTNLVSNAVKFSPEGAEVTLTARRAGQEVHVAVTDRGRGVPADKLESIFERFQQVDSSDSRQKGGTGLGLAICRSIVTQHGGRIWAESAPGEGSAFRFTLPVAVEAARAAPTAPDGTGPLVLVVDDEPSVCEVVCTLLEEWGYRPVPVHDGETAVAEALRLSPDAILLDVMMPGMDGRGTLAALKADPRTSAIPVVVLSALVPIAAMLDDGAASWVNKPFDIDVLLGALERAVGRGWKPARVLVVEDDADLARVLVETLQRHGVETVHAADGDAAVAESLRVEPDLIVLDLALPARDGFAVVDVLRRHDRLRSAPLVVYSAREVRAEERSRLRLGHTEFLTKGRVTPEEFERRVVGLLNRLVAHERTDPTGGEADGAEARAGG